MLSPEKSQFSSIDIPYKLYNQRLLVEITPEKVQERANHVKKADQFVLTNNSWQPNSYEGFAIISMLSDLQENEGLTNRLAQIQTELVRQLQSPASYFLLPAESFHQTIANTLSAGRFEKNIVGKNLEAAYPDIIREAFNQIQSTNYTTPIAMKMIGLGIFGTAIGILGTFENEADYNRVIGFRHGFYKNAQLAELDIKMTRPFIGHVTLAYLEAELSAAERQNLVKVINGLNAQLQAEENIFYIHTTSLRRYHHLAHFFTEGNFPVHTL
jgi:hypothetical protein